MDSNAAGPLAPILDDAVTPWGSINPIMPPAPAQADYPIDALPLGLADLVRAYAGWRECSLPAAAAALLATTTMLAMGDYRIDTPEPGKYAPATLYLAQVSPTGVGKTGISRPAMEPHYQTDRRLAHRWRIARRERQQFDRLPPKEQREQLENGAAAPEVTEHAPTLILSDATTEAAMQRLSVGQGRGAIGIFTSEAAELVGGWSFSRWQLNQTLARFAKAWDGETFTMARRKDNFEIRIESPQLTIYWQGQPGNLGQLLSSPEAGNGFAPRMLVCADDMPTTIAMESPAEPPEVRQFLAAITAGRERQDADREYFSENDGEVDLPVLMLDEADRQRLRMRRRLVLAEMQDAGETDGMPHYFGFMSRLAEHAARIAGILTAAEQYINYPVAQPASMPIPSDCITAGIMLAEWYAGELRRMTDAAGATELTAAAERMSLLISEVATGKRGGTRDTYLRRGELVNAGRIGLRYGNPALRKDAVLRIRSIAMLVDSGQIRPAIDMPHWFEVNPELLQ